MLFMTAIFLGISYGEGKEKKDGALKAEYRNAPSATVLWQVKVPVVGLRHMGRGCHLDTDKMGQFLRIQSHEKREVIFPLTRGSRFCYSVKKFVAVKVL